MIHSFPDNSSCRLPEAHNAQSADIHAPARKKSALLRSSVPPSAQKQHQNDESQNPDNRLKRCGAHFLSCSFF
jgi:hypothetical protein